MFGIVAVLGYDARSEATDAPPSAVATPAAPVVAPPPIKVVIHRVPATSLESQTEVVEVGTVAGVAVEPVVTATTTPEPIVLTADPVVRTVTVSAPGGSGSASGSATPAPASAPAPTATTSGSR